MSRQRGLCRSARCFQGGGGLLPGCGTESSRVHEVVVTRPQGRAARGGPVALWWVKRRLKCDNADCARKTFTE
jgi:hypothetical protein